MFYALILFADVPGAPDTPVISDITDNSMKVTWTPPANDGGSPIIEYYLEHKISSEFRWSPVTTSQIVHTEFVADTLRTGREYQFRVAAVNKAGASKWSEPSQSTVCKAPLGELLLAQFLNTAETITDRETLSNV